MTDRYVLSWSLELSNVGGESAHPRAEAPSPTEVEALLLVGASLHFLSEVIATKMYLNLGTISRR